MTLSEILQDIHACEEDMVMYERKYGIRSATFYESYMQGDEPPNGASVLDWAGWSGIYAIWLERQQQYYDVAPKWQLFPAKSPLPAVIAWPSMKF